jgi:hypothetical protein
MRKILTIALGLTMCASAAMASNVGVYQDAAGTNCSLNPAPGLLTIYMVQNLNPGSTGVKFMINDLLGIGASIATNTTAGYLTIGTYFAGIEITYPSCKSGDNLLGSR